MEKTIDGTTVRTCRACGKKFDYPAKGSSATRHHCEDCINIPAGTRKVFERLASRIQQLENTVKRLQDKPAAAQLPGNAPRAAAESAPPGSS